MEKQIYNIIIKDSGEVCTLDGEQKKAYDNGRGYLIVFLKIGDKKTSKAIHRLLAEAFIPNPEGLSDVDHINGDKRDNSLSNLRWCSHGKNIKHSYDSGRRSAKGENNSRAYLKTRDVERICQLFLEGKTARQASELTNIPLSITNNIKSKRCWRDITNKYEW